MVKSELISRIHRKLKNLSFKDVELAVNHILEHMSITLSKRTRIEIRHFGSFSSRHRPSRQAHNPKTGEWAYTQEKYTPHFKPGKDLRDRVNESRKQHEIKQSTEDDATGSED